jgi:hypothetical protein
MNICSIMFFYLLQEITLVYWFAYMLLSFFFFVTHKAGGNLIRILKKGVVIP